MVQSRRGDAEPADEHLQTVRAAAPHLGEDHALQALRADLRAEISGLEMRIDELARDEPVSNGWASHVDPATGRTYYYTAEGETSWERPVWTLNPKLCSQLATYREQIPGYPYTEYGLGYSYIDNMG